jgi:DNA ligase D-like protein (predicted ligase)/DNA ligase D-like protein (predicted 3'-phosphoesterase)
VPPDRARPSAEETDRLATYRGMRDPAKTPEPVPPAGPLPEGNDDTFVIQEHHARSLHWDVRLERNGVLVSWAVPKGLPLDPKENRLAVHTEDHPLEYLTFEDTIPSGEYGAGSMTIWDTGTYETEKFNEREVIVRLEGTRARGRYAIFHTRDKDWIIHRMDPPEPGRTPMPDDLAPMLATMSALPRRDDGWAFEVKWDGTRTFAYGEPGRLRLVSRAGQDVTDRYPEIHAMTRAIGARHVVLDGELVALDAAGRPDFASLQGRMYATSTSDIRRRQRQTPVTYMIFDLLFLDGRSLLDKSYEERRRELDTLGLSGPRWHTPAYQHGNGAALLAAARDQGLEGIVAKRLDSAYVAGARTADWLKVMNLRRQDVVIGGMLEGAANGEVGALLVGCYDESDVAADKASPRLRFAGKVAAGLDTQTQRRLRRLLAPLERGTTPFTGRQPERGTTFVEPHLVAKLDFADWTKTGTLRSPTFLGLRDDTPPQAVTREPLPGPGS